MKIYFKIAKNFVAGATLVLVLLSPLQPLVAHAQFIDPLSGYATPTTVTNPDAKSTSACALWGSGPSFGSGSGGAWAHCITDIVYVFTVGIGSGFAYVAAYFFDITAQLTLNGISYSLAFISQGWTTARDLANMAFLFILIYIAFMIMFKAETSGVTTLLATVILVALLINFSFFFTRVVIDAGNLLSIQFYNAINAPPISASPGLTSAASNITQLLGQSANTKDLTASVMNMLNLQGLLSNSSFDAFTKSGNYTFTNVLISLTFLYIAAGIMLWLLTVMFATVGVKFLMRIVVLWFLIIVSPLALIARALPAWSGQYQRWQRLLIEHAFYPAVFMFILLMLNNFAAQMSDSRNGLLGGLFSDLARGDPNQGFIATIATTIANVGIRMGFVIGVLYIGLVASKQIGVMGANAAENFGSRVGGWYRNTMSYGAGATWRNTGGRLAGFTSDTIARSKWANNTNRFNLGGILGYRLRKNVTEPLANTSLGTIATSYRGRQTFLDTRRTEMDKNRDDRLVRIKNRNDAQDLAKLDSKLAPTDTRLKEIEGRVEELDEVLKSATPPPTAAGEKSILTAERNRLRSTDDYSRREQLKKNVEKIEGAQVIELKSKDIEGIIKHISDKQVKAIKESLKFSNQEKQRIEHNWHEASSKGPLGESKEQLKKLGEIHTTLKNLGTSVIDVAKLKQYHAVAESTGPININLGVAKNITKELKDELAKQEDIRDDTGKLAADRQTARLAVRQLKDAVSKAETLEKQVAEVPKNTGGSDKEGEFSYKRT